MIEDEWDRALQRVFHEAFPLTRGWEDRLWREFSERNRHEERVWATFMDVMLQAAASVQRAVEWSAWPARGVPGLI